MNNLNICENCKHWKPCGVSNNEDDFKPCTNESVFRSFPETINETKKLLKGDKNIAMIDGVKKYSYNKEKERDFVFTGRHFGCVCFESNAT